MYGSTISSLSCDPCWKPVFGVADWLSTLPDVLNLNVSQHVWNPAVVVQIGVAEDKVGVFVVFLEDVSDVVPRFVLIHVGGQAKQQEVQKPSTVEAD